MYMVVCMYAYIGTLCARRARSTCDHLPLHILLAAGCTSHRIDTPGGPEACSAHTHELTLHTRDAVSFLVSSLAERERSHTRPCSLKSCT